MITATPGALSGIRVVDMTTFLAGSYATMLLADMGADVIKLEAPPLGDPYRYREDDHGYSSSFAAVNRNKRSVLLDLKSSAGQEAFGRLIATADVLVTSLRPRSRAALGLDFEDLSERHPRLVYCSLTGLGESGPAVDRPAFDTTAQALSGLLSLIAQDYSKPIRIKSFVSDQLAGLYACYGILAALYAREKTGRGQKVGTSLLRASIAFSVQNFYHYFAAERSGKAERASVHMRTAGFLFHGGDEKPFAVHVPPSPPRIWVAFITAFERVDLQGDPRFSDKRGREENYEALHAILADQARLRPRTYWLERLEKFDVSSAPIYSLGEVFADPIVQHLQLLARVTDPFGDERLTVRSGVEMSDTPATVPLRAPLAGESGHALLKELGYTDAEIARFIDEAGDVPPRSTLG